MTKTVKKATMTKEHCMEKWSEYGTHVKKNDYLY